LQTDTVGDFSMLIAADIVDLGRIAVEHAGPGDWQEMAVGAGAESHFWASSVEASDNTIDSQALLIRGIRRAELRGAIPVRMDLKDQVIPGLVMDRPRSDGLPRQHQSICVSIVAYPRDQFDSSEVSEPETIQKGVPDHRRDSAAQEVARRIHGRESADAAESHRSAQLEPVVGRAEEEPITGHDIVIRMPAAHRRAIARNEVVHEE
jgi:hypothetical protein